MSQSLYDSFVKFLYSLHHPTYETSDGRHHQWSLRQMNDFCEFLGNPQKKLKVIHVAGTNGKGSCVSIIASYLQLAGFKVGIYISPEILDIKERIQVNGELISINFVEQFYKEILNYRNLCEVKTYSQVLVAMAFSYFYTQKVDYAIIETGIGGALDPTNIVMPILSVITTIGYDHTSLLGYDLESIARSKGGIIKDMVPVVIGGINKSLKSIFSEIAKNKLSPIFFTNELKEDYQRIKRFDFAIPYQQSNAECCWLAINVLSRLKYISKPNLRLFQQALSVHCRLYNLRGRWEQICRKPDIFLDICDNELGAKCVFNFIENIMKRDLYDRLIIIMGLTGPSKLNMAKYFPSNALYYYTQSHGYISADNVKTSLGHPGECYQTPVDAINSYLHNKRDTDLVLVVGSIHIITDAIRFFDTNLEGNTEDGQ